jgi:hypothetical protein
MNATLIRFNEPIEAPKIVSAVGVPIVKIESRVATDTVVGHGVASAANL